MKKVVLTVAIALGGLSTYANPVIPVNQTHKMEIVTQDKYKEIKAEALPKAVKDALAKDYPTATIDKAYVNDKHEYKLEIMMDGAASTVYADKHGNWIKKD